MYIGSNDQLSVFLIIISIRPAEQPNWFNMGIARQQEAGNAPLHCVTPAWHGEGSKEWGMPVGKKKVAVCPRVKCKSIDTACPSVQAHKPCWQLSQPITVTCVAVARTIPAPHRLRLLRPDGAAKNGSELTHTLKATSQSASMLVYSQHSALYTEEDSHIKVGQCRNAMICICVSARLCLLESRILLLANGLIEDIGITPKWENTHTHTHTHIILAQTQHVYSDLVSAPVELWLVGVSVCMCACVWVCVWVCVCACGRVCVGVVQCWPRGFYPCEC